MFFSLVTLSLNNVRGNLLYRCRRFMKKVYKYTTEIALAYGVLEPLHFWCKIDTKQWEISWLPGPKVLGRTATFLISLISSVYNWYILKIRKLPEFQSTFIVCQWNFKGLSTCKTLNVLSHKTKAVMLC